MEREPIIPKPQTEAHAFGTRYLTHSIIDTPLSLIGTTVVAPFIALGLLLSAPFCGPLLYQRFAMWLMTGPLRDTLAGVLLMRIPTFLYDWPMIFWWFLSCSIPCSKKDPKAQAWWVDTPLSQAYAESRAAKYGRNLIFWSTLRIGDHKLATEIAMDPKRKRTGALDAWQLKAFHETPLVANLPVCYNTDGAYHQSWSRSFFKYVAGAREVTSKWDDDSLPCRAALEASGAAETARKWAAGGPPSYTYDSVGMLNVKLLMNLLFDVREEALTKGGLHKLVAPPGIGGFAAAYVLTPPSCPPIFGTAFSQSVILIKTFLFRHCNARLSTKAAGPNELLGRPIDWEAMANEVDGIEWMGQSPARVPGCWDAFMSHCSFGDCCGVNGAPCCDCCGCAPCFCACGCEISEVPSMAQPKVDALLNTICCTLVINAAGPQAGISTLLGKFIARPVPAMMALSATPACCRPSGFRGDLRIEAQKYESDKIAYMLETLRLDGPPVAGSHKVVDERGFECPFLNSQKVSLPPGSVVMADYFSSMMDPKAWNCPYDFRLDRDQDKYIFFNGPYKRPAPRKCPGEALSMCLMSLVLDAVLEHSGWKEGGGDGSPTAAPARISMERVDDPIDVESQAQAGAASTPSS